MQSTSTGPILFSLLNGDLINAASGLTKGELSYMYLVGEGTIFSSNETIGVCTVELPFVSGAHLVGIPVSQSGLTSVLNGQGMEPVVLETGFNDVFHLYAKVDQQFEARYVLDPAAMIFLIDFCKQYTWEIHEDMLYFLSKGASPDLATVDEFVRHIRPAVEVESDRARNPAKLPYKHGHGRKILCPHCEDRLDLGRAWMECPKGHGFLLSGAQIRDERESTESIDYAIQQASTSLIGQKLACPYRGGAMLQNRYQHSNIIIDVCQQCPHRWLDGHEIEAVLSV